MTTTVQTTTIESNPFALMMDPDAVFAALAQSDRLSRLKSRICRPLDKPTIAKVEAAEEPVVSDIDFGLDDEVSSPE